MSGQSWGSFHSFMIALKICPEIPNLDSSSYKYSEGLIGLAIQFQMVSLLCSVVLTPISYRNCFSDRRAPPLTVIKLVHEQNGQGHSEMAESGFFYPWLFDLEVPFLSISTSSCILSVDKPHSSLIPKPGSILFLLPFPCIYLYVSCLTVQMPFPWPAVFSL